jgi:hypothetical protein
MLYLDQVHHLRAQVADHLPNPGEAETMLLVGLLPDLHFKVRPGIPKLDDRELCLNSAVPASFGQLPGSIFDFKHI